MQRNGDLRYSSHSEYGEANLQLHSICQFGDSTQDGLRNIEWELPSRGNMYENPQVLVELPELPRGVVVL